MGDGNSIKIAILPPSGGGGAASAGGEGISNSKTELVLPQVRLTSATSNDVSPEYVPTSPPPSSSSPEKGSKNGGGFGFGGIGAAAIGGAIRGMYKKLDSAGFDAGA